MLEMHISLMEAEIMFLEQIQTQTTIDMLEVVEKTKRMLFQMLTPGEVVLFLKGMRRVHPNACNTN